MLPWFVTESASYSTLLTQCFVGAIVAVCFSKLGKAHFRIAKALESPTEVTPLSQYTSRDSFFCSVFSFQSAILRNCSCSFVCSS